MKPYMVSTYVNPYNPTVPSNEFGDVLFETVNAAIEAAVKSGLVLFTVYGRDSINDRKDGLKVEDITSKTPGWVRWIGVTPDLLEQLRCDGGDLGNGAKFPAKSMLTRSKTRVS